MQRMAATTLALTLFAASCSTTSTRTVVDADPEVRATLLDSVASLAGRWEGQVGEGEAMGTTFAVSSAGSAVREVMAEGTEHEMTNMYTLDGNTLVMTHYCAAGNQATMRASSIEDGRVVFRFDSVRDLKAADEHYMGEMTLVLIDDDHIEQHWRSFREDELDHEMVIPMVRR